MKLEWTEQAVRDLKAVQDYISRDSSFYARRLIEKIIAVSESLDSFPARGRLVPEAKNECVRELLVRPYRIIYRTETDRVRVMAVIHGSRDLGAIRPEPWQKS